MLILNHVSPAFLSYFNSDVAYMQKVLNINFLSYVTMTVASLPMLKNSGGSIVVVSSLAGEYKQHLCEVALSGPQSLRAP